MGMIAARNKGLNQDQVAGERHAANLFNTTYLPCKSAILRRLLL